MNGVILTNTDTDEDKTLLVNTWRDVTFQLKSLLSGVYIYLYNNKINASALIGQSAMVYCASKPMKKSRVFSIII